jgi:hypothetical protein
MARHALDGRNNFLVGDILARDILSRADEGCIPPVHDDGSARIRIASKGRD